MRAVLLACVVLVGSVRADEPQRNQLVLASPQEYQIVQRDSRGMGRFPIRGTWSGSEAEGLTLECRIGTEKNEESWKAVPIEWHERTFTGVLNAAQGGWHRLDIRLQRNTLTEGAISIEHLGVGEIFVVAGQSNSANYGEEKQRPQSGLVSTFDGQHWRQADDPQPGAGGMGGSFMPPLGDLLVARLKVPVGFVACGIGATSVREWLPKGKAFPNPPTIEANVLKRADGQWESNGAAYEMLVGRMKPFGPQGFRAVLWHQGESDANQKDASRTFPGVLYRNALATVIKESRREIDLDAPWFVAQASYHVPGDESSDDIREAQAATWKDGTAQQGPDTDALKSTWRESGGRGVHFSGPGLRRHAELWADRLIPWIEGRQ